jgi:hypothetical protein
MGDSWDTCDLRNTTLSVVPRPISIAKGLREENHKLYGVYVESG